MTVNNKIYSKFFTASDGLRLHYLLHPCEEMKSKSYCLLLHGFTNDAHIWDDLAAKLRLDHHVVALDMRGHGDSEWDSKEQYSHWTLAEDLQEFMGAFVGAEWHVIGHSLGGRVAIISLEDIVQRILSLTVVDAGPEVSKMAGDRIVNDALKAPEYFKDVEDFKTYLQRIYLVADAVRIDQMASFGLRFHNKLLRMKTDPAFTPGVWHKSDKFLQMEKEQGELSDRLWRALGSLSFPVHLVRGQASAILESQLARKMIEKIGANATLSVVSKAGHAVIVDNPKVSEELIVDFIKKAQNI